MQLVRHTSSPFRCACESWRWGGPSIYTYTALMVANTLAGAGCWFLGIASVCWQVRCCDVISIRMRRVREWEDAFTTSCYWVDNWGGLCFHWRHLWRPLKWVSMRSSQRPLEKGLLRHNNQEHLRQVSGWCGLSDGATVLLKIDNLIEVCQFECGSLVWQVSFSSFLPPCNLSHWLLTFSSLHANKRSHMN